MLKHDYIIIFGVPGGCRVPVLIGDRRPNPARLPVGITRASQLAPLTREERLLVTQIANGDKPWRRYIRGGWRKFLTPPTGNPKILKGLRKYGIATAVLHLAPAAQSGRTMCVTATPGCTAGCLTTAGRGGIPGKKRRKAITLVSGTPYVPPNSIQEARVLKTIFFWEQRQDFMHRLAGAIAGFVDWARKRRMKAAIRLNGTSDIRWEAQAFTYGGRRYRNLMEAFPGVQFYDYTKNPFRLDGGHFPRNYHLTFSIAETGAQPQQHAAHALKRGMNLAVVFDTRKNRSLPRTWAGLPVIDADLHDMRFLDNWENRIKGPLVAGLRAKGRAIGDSSGFVRNAGSEEDEFFVGAPVFQATTQPIFLMSGAR